MTDSPTEQEVSPPALHQALRQAYRAARAAGATRHRDIAATLGVSEGELIAAHVAIQTGEAMDGLRATRLQPQWPALIGELHAVGEVMALTRNASCVHEKVGRYDNASASGPMGLVLGGAIDLRVFYNHWAHGFAVDEATPGKGLQRSLQFYDGSGTAIHKVFFKPVTDVGAWNALVARFADAAATPGLAARPAPARVEEWPDESVDVARFREGWAGLRDTHDFFGLLKKHNLGRTQALRLAEPRFACRVQAGSARLALQAAAAAATPVMVFVGNRGMIQIHSGPVQRVQLMESPGLVWLNVLDPGFNLHLREDRIAQAWAVRKPTVDGPVTSLEFFDADGETIAMFFGERKPGRPELAAWRQIVDRAVAAAGGSAPWQAEEAAPAHAPC